MTDEIRFVESTGKDVESAVAAGLAKLGLRRDEVIVEILEEGSRGFLGLGGRQSTVRITSVVGHDQEADSGEAPPKPARPAPPPQKPRDAGPQRGESRGSAPRREQPAQREEKPAPRRELRESRPRSERPRGDRPAARAAQKPRDNGAERPQRQRSAAPIVDEPPLTEEEIQAVVSQLETLLAKMELDVTIGASVSPVDEMSGRRMLLLTVDGEDLGALIGPRGDSLNALQYVLRLMAGHKLQRRVNLTLDVGGYRERRRQALMRLAERMAKKVLAKSRPVTLEPMPPFERRIIHMTLRESDQVTTSSVGEGDRRRVRIYPKS